MKWTRMAASAALLLATQSVQAAQDGLELNVQPRDPVLTFDWPEVQIGVGSYEAGPTGLTIIRFAHKVAVVADARGGAPGTVNTDTLNLGYDSPRIDAVVFAGGSNYGEEAVTATMTGIKEDGQGTLPGGIARATGAIIFDLGDRRLNEIYPDKRLAQAALHALMPGRFPLGAQGAGRMAMQGSFFGCQAHSGQGGAFRQIGPVKIAAFVVVNALGSVVDRQGRLVSCHPAANWPAQTDIAKLMGNLPASRAALWDPSGPTHQNTTLSLIVTNQKLDTAGLRRLAVQVHTSMARAIQPFSTFDDGDILFAASTGEVTAPLSNSATSLSPNNLNTIAGETMWDAILASVPEDAPFSPPPAVAVAPAQLALLVGSYEVGPQRQIQVGLDGNDLQVTAKGRSAFEFANGKPTAVVPISATEFYVAGRYRTRLKFAQAPNGAVTGLTINPGRWAQSATRSPN